MLQRKKGFEYVSVGILWVLILTLTPNSVDVNWPVEFWYRQLFLALLLTVGYILHSQYLLPKLLDRNKFLIYGLSVIGVITAILLLVHFFEDQIELPRRMHELFRPEKPYNPENRRGPFDFTSFFLILFDLSLGVIIFLVRKQQNEQEIRKELEQLQVRTELSYLKAQINPHFFFNTLNNIYALTSIDVEASRTAILKLSAMMRYVIYDGDSQHATVSDEINFIENYIELMKLRLSKKVTLKFTKPSGTYDQPIAPMLLLPFVENAFKHGISSTVASEVIITIQLTGNVLDLYVENPIFPKSGEQHEEHGIGIANTRRRLELLYPSRYNFEIDDKDNTFKVSLQIEL
ncbi:sensor histidine kinase [Fulvivirga sedimenti]|uniref:Histidine kinase n=1 Tax=Fulvivirga sedimenti TaxID=2879465 RepID=A0A9X1HPB6_9BACT|nr:histidine kinase [Fulvivirga sedimenti]MCA6074676.1 histidine kinase [Fulvivirga sedimenti]MCA6075853.1 histidine kinase [Fulvivirga sedimenti]MCA6076981.1 histidine kinase [Fulvivirga sedimenti]